MILGIALFAHTLSLSLVPAVCVEHYSKTCHRPPLVVIINNLFRAYSRIVRTQNT